jgi:hypothetical protein
MKRSALVILSNLTVCIDEHVRAVTDYMDFLPKLFYMTENEGKDVAK